MYQAQLCVGLNPSLGITDGEQIRLLHQIGFDGFFAGWNRQTDVAALRRAADETGMLFQSIHGPFLHIDSLWMETEHTRPMMDDLLACLQDCADFGVPIMVSHAFIGFDVDYVPTAYGIENFRVIVSRARELGVKIAFENTEGEPYLAALMEVFADDPTVGFCLDTGHELCYNRGKDMLSLYGNKVICTHLNDNLGVSAANGHIFYTDDLHLLPFDGIADWDDITRRLSAHGFDAPLTFELKTASPPGRYENDPYRQMPPQAYLTQAYMRACRVGALMIKNRL